MAGEITRPWPGGRPGPWRTFADKPVVSSVDRGSTRITQLRPGKFGPAFATIAAKAGSSVGTARPDTQITKLRPGKLGPVYAAIADKAPSVTDAKASSDTYLVYLQLSNTDALQVEVTDTYRPVLTLGGTSQITIVGSDTYRPVLTLTTSGIVTGSPTLVSRSDTYRPVLTLATRSLLAGEYYASTDTYVPILALANASLEKIDIVAVSDTYRPVLSFGFTLTPHTYSTVPAQDTYTPVLTLSGAVSDVATDVDRIVGSLHPYGVITGRWI
jgi:hypothetical protein